MNSKLITDFSKVKVLLIGDFMLDHYIQGTVSRISPEAPVPVVNVNKETFSLGGAGNVATNVSSLGGHVKFIFVAGKQYEQAINALLEDKKIDGSAVYDDTRKTTIKKRIIGMNQQLLRLDYEDTHQINDEIHNKIIKEIEKNISETDIIIISDYAKGLLTEKLTKKIIEIGNKNNIKTIIDPKPQTMQHCKNCFLITPNHFEASGHVGIHEENGDRIIMIGEKIQNELNCNVLITRGEKGMALFESNKKPFLLKTEAKQVYDVTGAGDTVTTIIALSVGAGAPLKEAIELANRGAGIVVGKRGTASLTPEELIRGE